MRAAFPLLAALSLGPAFADEPAPDIATGLDITLETSAAVRGGAQTGEALQALTVAHVSWQRAQADSTTTGFRGFASVLNHSGRGPTARFLGDFLAASNIEAYDSTRLYSWWFEIEQAPWSLRAGALLADEEFAGTETGGHLINSVFGWPAFISANTVNTGPAFFVAAPGVRLAHAFTPGVTCRIGLYDGDTFDSPSGDPAVNRHGVHYQLGGDQGWFMIAELAYAAEGNPTRLKAGFWRHTATFADQYLDDAGQPFVSSGRAPRDHSGNFGGYVAVERALAGQPGQPGHVDCFARLGGAPSDRNTLAWVWDGGVAWTGPWADRPGDVLAVGFAHAGFSPRLAASAHLLDPAAPSLDAEQVVEVSYTFALGGHFACKPDLQFIRHPGGSSAFDDALLLTVRLTANF